MQKITASLAEKDTPQIPEKSVIRRALTRRSSSSGVPVVTVAPTVRESIPVSSLQSLIDIYTDDCRMLQHTAATIHNKNVRLGGLLWFVNHKKFVNIGLNELKAFFLYLSSDAPPGGRWGIPNENQKLKPGTVKSYHATVRALFNWMVRERRLDESPMERIPVPIDRPDQIQPFTPEQCQALYNAAGRTAYAERDRAMIFVLLNTGIRASELCSLVHDDMNLQSRTILIREGKGGKSRTVPLSPDTVKALYAYRDVLGEFLPNDAVFVSERGRDHGKPLTRSGLLQLIERLGIAANIKGVRCSPHTFRHTFAITYLRPRARGGYGGNVFTLKTILGHESLTMTNRYVALADADISEQHRQFSPIEGLRTTWTRK